MSLSDKLSVPCPPGDDVFFLGGQAYIYTEQDWKFYPQVANQAFIETRNLAWWVYWPAYVSGTTVVEDGKQLTREQIYARLIELVGGLCRLRPHVTVKTLFSASANVLFLGLVL